LRGIGADRFADEDLATGENARACKVNEPTTRQTAGSAVNLMLNYFLCFEKQID